MKRFIFAVLIFNFISTTTVFARKPAVEDFVGVESQDYSQTPPGTEVLFNFTEGIEQMNTDKPLDSSTNTSQAFAWFAIFSFIALPFLMWFGITKKQTSEQATQSVKKVPSDKTLIRTEPNVAKLEDYRNEENKHKKAS